MRFSARLAAWAGAAALVIPGTAGAAVAARAGFGGLHQTIVSRGARLPYSGVAPTIVQRGPRAGYAGYGIRPTIVPRGRRGYGYGYGYGGGLGLGYDGYDTSDLGGAVGYPPGSDGFGALPPPVFPPVPPACPLIIKVGRGLAHAVKTRVVYGRPVCRP